MNTQTVTYVKENANKLDLDEPLVVTQNGKAKYVVQSFEDYEYQQESLALLKLVNLAEQGAKGAPIDEDEAFSLE